MSYVPTSSSSTGPGSSVRYTSQKLQIRSSAVRKGGKAPSVLQTSVLQHEIISTHEERVHFFQTDEQA